MRKMIPSALALFAFVLATPILANADAVLGTYLTDKGDSKVLIFKCGAKYCGKISWLKEPNNKDGTPKTDTNNPNAGRRKNPIMGMNLVWGFSFDGSDWSGGHIYNPRDGKTYKCTMKLSGRQLTVRGYIGYGFASIGKTVVWTKM